MASIRPLKILIAMAIFAIAVPAGLSAKPNSYPGEHSAFEPLDPTEVAKRKAERAKRIELRKQRREDRRKKRSNKKFNRSN